MELFEQLPLGIALLDSGGRITHANRCLRAWFRLLPANASGEMVPAHCVACGGQCTDLCRELRARVGDADGLPYLRRVQFNDGVILEARCERVPDKPGFLLVVEDVTRKLQGERALEEANARLADALAERSRELTYNREFLRSLIETNRDLVLAADGGGIVTFANMGFAGAAAGTLIGKSLADLVDGRYLDDFRRQYRDVLSGRAAHALLEASGAGMLADRWCLFSVGPMRAGGEVSGLTVIVSDMTALHDAWERVRGSEKLVATGRMAARIAHEINNPLTGISGAIHLIKSDLPDGSPAIRYAEMVEREIARISNVVRQMYGLYRPEHEASRTVDLRPLLDEVVTLMRVDAAQKRVRLVSRVTTQENAIVQEQNLRQTLMNIIRNAIEVTPAGGLIEITVERHGRCVDVVVTDEGPGVPDELQQQMFEPFFTTKSSSGGRGLGLGLSISDSLMKAMGGSILFENRPDGGARCKICLPEAGGAGITVGGSVAE